MLNMTLEDFFTLTEMKDGLTAPDRVKELIDVLQKDKHNTVKNVGDSTRQWSAVASTIASTENKDCLALFLQLDGLCYFDTWLKHGQKCFQETGDSFIEETMIVLLGAIEKLHREEQKSVMSEIMMTVKDLLSNNSSRVQDRARALFDSWKQYPENNVVQMDVDKDEAVCDDVVDVNGNPGSKHEQAECSSQDISTSRCINSEEFFLEPATDEITPAIRPETMQSEVGVDLTIRPSDENSDRASLNDASPDPVHSCTLNLLSESSSVLRNPSKHQLEATTGIKSSGSAVTGKFGVAKSNEHDEAKPMLQIRSCRNLGLIGTFCADSANTVESKVGANNEKDADVEKGGPCLNKNSSGDVRKGVYEGINEMYDSISPNPCSKISASDSAAPVDALQGCFVNELNMGKSVGATSSLSGKEDSEAIKESNSQNVSNEVELVCGNKVELVSNEMYDSISPNPCSKISASDSAAPVDALQGSSVNELNMGKSEGVTSNLSGKEDTEAIEESNGQNVSNEVELVCGNVDLTANLSRKEGKEAIEATELSDGQNVTDKDEVNTGNEDITTNLLRKEDAEAIEKPNAQNVSDEDEFVRGNDPEFFMSGTDFKHSVQMKSDFQLDYDMFDPLEVAQQVAIEVDCREPSGSSSERMSGGGIRLPESPDPMKGKNSRVIHFPCKDMSTGPNLSAVVGDKVFVKATTLPIERENCVVDIEMAHKIEPDEDKHVCGFDLNENVLSDDNTDSQTNSVTAPISLVSTSMAATTSGLPLSPLQFDGTHGCKGSAETSAFCPAPTHKVSEGENSIFASGSSSSLFRRSEYLDFDLNVAESEYCKISDLPPKETPNSTARPSGDSSLESCPKRSDLLQLDLNCVSDSGDAPSSYWRKEERVLPHFNGQFSPSASSSSSSMQPSLKTIDLNDQPSPFTEYFHPAFTAKSSPNLHTPVSERYNTNETVISLMGTRIEVNQKDNVPQTIPLFNDMIVDPALDASMPRSDSVLGFASSSLYAHSYMYGNHGPPYGPAVPYSLAIYGLGGQIPYMVDSRGAPVVPQVLGPVPALPPSFPQQPSFFESLAAAPANSNGFVPSRHGFDLNSGLMFEERSRDAGNTRQLLNSGQEISMDGQMRANPPSTSSSGVGGKRKEMDGGWDPYPFNYKHHQPGWK